MARKILLADDSVTAQNMGRKILVDAGYEVVTVNNGSAALKRVTESKPDLIVLDVYMPGYSGLEVCQRLKESPETAHIPILLTVGKLEPFKPDEARRARADAHIVKPFEASELLTALARLEDRMVPSAGGRFSTSVSGVERFGGDERFSAEASDPDTGWKSRLRFPSKKKKEEPEPEPEDDASYRDYRKGKKKAPAKGAAATSSPVAQEPGLVPDIPRDITPEELDALSALAAKLDGPGSAPAAEKVASLAEKVGPASVAPAVAKIEEAAADGKSSESKPAESKPTAAPTKEFEVSAAPSEAAAAVAASGAPVSGSAANNVVQIPLAQTPVMQIPTSPSEPAAGAASPAAQAESAQATSSLVPASEVGSGVVPQQAEAAAEGTRAEIETKNDAASTARSSAAQEALPAANAAESSQESAKAEEKFAAEKTSEPVAAAPLAQDAAPVDRQDEPMFASAVAAEAKTDAKAEGTEASPIAAAEATPAQKEQEKTAVEVRAAESRAVGQAEFAKAELATSEEAKVAESPGVPESRTAPEEKLVAEAATAEPKAELAVPNAAATEPPVAARPAAEENADAPAPSDEELAEALRLLTPSTVNTDAAMPSHGTLVAAGQMLAEEAARNATRGPRWVAQAVALTTEEAAISLEAEMFRTFAHKPSKDTPDVAIAAMAAVEPAPVVDRVSAIAAVVESRMAEVEKQAAPATMAAEAGTATETSAPRIEAVAAEAIATDGSQDSHVKEHEEAAEEHAATFADVAMQQEQASVAPQPEDAARAAQPAETVMAGGEAYQNSAADAGGDEDMGKENSGWHQIRRPVGAPAAGDAVEAAKQSDSAAEPQKAMAAAASADGGTAATDPNAIASIVDSVLADLRPKIVEEIAKKLGGK